MEKSDRIPRKLAAILYADVAGYARLTGEDEDATHRTLSEYLDLISGSVESHRGRVMHYAGDALLAVFEAVVDATTGSPLWSQRYDRQLDDLFALQDEVTRAIAATLMGDFGKLRQVEVGRAKRKATSSLSAYDCLLRGMNSFLHFTREDNAAARQMFEQAIKMDANYAAAYYWLGWTYAQRLESNWSARTS